VWERRRIHQKVEIIAYLGCTGKSVDYDNSEKIPREMAKRSIRYYICLPASRNWLGLHF
jgi:hypothetical protein